VDFTEAARRFVVKASFACIAHQGSRYLLRRLDHVALRDIYRRPGHSGSPNDLVDAGWHPVAVSKAARLETQPTSPETQTLIPPCGEGTQIIGWRHFLGGQLRAWPHLPGPLIARRFEPAWRARCSSTRLRPSAARRAFRSAQVSWRRLARPYVRVSGLSPTGTVYFHADRSECRSA
jgi:hypothetical protein